MFDYVQNLLSELSYHRKLKAAAETLELNPLVDWWLKFSYEPRMRDVLYKMPPPLHVPISDEEVLIACNVIESVQHGQFDPDAYLGGSLRPKKLSFWSNFWGCFFALPVILFLIWDLTVNPKIPLILGLVIGIFGCAPLIPFISYIMQARRLRFGVHIEKFYFALFPALALGLFFLTDRLVGYWIDTDFSRWEAIFWTTYFAFTSIILTVIIDCYLIKLLKRKIHIRRMET